jgi:hypothetical protein
VGRPVPGASPAGGVAPAGYRRHRNVKRFRKPLKKALSQNEKGKVVVKKASATG